MRSLFLLLLAMVSGVAFGNAADGWEVNSPYAKIVGERLVVDVPAGKENQAPMARKRISLAPYSNKSLELTVTCRGENVSAPDKSWLGFKVMLHYKNEAGQDQWPQAARLTGTFADRKVTLWQDFSRQNLDKGEICLGLQSGSGRVEFDLASLSLRAADPIYPTVNGSWRVKYPDRVAKMPRLRGVMLPASAPTRADFATLKSWGVTLARYQMCRNWGRANTNQDLGEYDRWIDEKLDTLERILPWAREDGIRLVVDLHVPPGGRDESSDMNMFYDERYARHFVEVWQKIARRFKGRPEIYGFDLINEPTQTRRALPDCDYWNLQRRAAEAVRAIDPSTPIIVESNGWDSPATYPYLSPLKMDNVIYQFHLYVPHAFTHQGVSGGWTKTAYPDAARGWNKEMLRAEIKPVLEFQKKHNCRIYVGEFSAITWAQGAEAYLADCISLFEEYGFDWTYHAFREWQGWSVEHACDGPGAPFRASADNPRKRVLLDALKVK